MEIISIYENEVTEVVGDGENYIFGASDTGKRLAKKLLDQGLVIRGIWDNDVLKQGEYIYGIPIISYDTLEREKNINLFIGCAYALQEENRINQLKCRGIYELGKTTEDLKERFSAYAEDIKNFIAVNDENKEIYADQQSKQVSDAIVEFMTKYDASATKKIASKEEHYLIKEVLDYGLSVNSVFVDCGAFTGEFPISLINNNIKFEKCYCFEMENDNCKKAVENMRKMGLEEKVEVVNAGISQKSGMVYFEKSGANSKLVEYQTPNCAKVVSIDDYFSDTHVNFIKMDIEGAEMGALKGGISVIKRDRPILAISVYHSLEDRMNIPRYLYNELDEYKFYLRQHSIWFAETVLYAIPK